MCRWRAVPSDSWASFYVLEFGQYGLNEALYVIVITNINAAHQLKNLAKRKYKVDVYRVIAKYVFVLVSSFS